METAHDSEREQEGFTYTQPEGKDQTDRRVDDKPEAFRNIREEAAWHQKNLAFTTVTRANDEAWTKESLLDAIEAGHIDVFTMNQFRFPPTPEGEWITTFTALYFDDREFGPRIANRVLIGHNRQPQLQLDD